MICVGLKTTKRKPVSEERWTINEPCGRFSLRFFFVALFVNCGLISFFVIQFLASYRTYFFFLGCTAKYRISGQIFVLNEKKNDKIYKYKNNPFIVNFFFCNQSKCSPYSTTFNDGSLNRTVFGFDIFFLLFFDRFIHIQYIYATV